VRPNETIQQGATMFRKMILRFIEVLCMDLVTLLPEPMDRLIITCHASDSRIVSYGRLKDESDAFEYTGGDHFLNDDPYDFRKRFDPERFIADPLYSHMLGNIYHDDGYNF
jgi:hypothetical protein